MSIPTDENRGLRTLVAVMRAKPGKEEELRAALESLIEPTKAEDGCHTYALHRGSEDPSLFIFYENWTSDAHLDAHLAMPYLVDFGARIPELLDDSGLSLNRVRPDRLTPAWGEARFPHDRSAADRALRRRADELGVLAQHARAELGLPR